MTLNYNIPRTCDFPTVKGHGTPGSPFVDHKCQYKAIYEEPETHKEFSWYEGGIVEVSNPHKGEWYCKKHSYYMKKEKEAELDKIRYQSLKIRSLGE